MRWPATAARLIPFAIRSSGCGRTTRTKFLESFYFQYGHASIADLGHVVLCFEGISELAATEIEDEQLWDGQARSSRYQDFSKSGFVTPPEFDAAQAALYQEAAGALLAGYNEIHAKVFDYLADKLPRPEVDEAGSLSAQCAGACVRCRALLVVLGIPDRRGTSDQHSHAGAAGAAAEGVRIPRTAELGGGNRRSLRRGALPAMERGCAREAVAPTLARHLDADEHAAAESGGSAGVGEAESDRGHMPDRRRPVDLMKPARHGVPTSSRRCFIQ